MIDRRLFIAGAAASAPTLSHARAGGFGAGLGSAIAAIERSSGGRLGVAVLDTRTGRRFARRGDDRFPMCSTFKFLLAAAVLKASDQGRERLDRPIAVRAGDIVGHSPMTKAKIGASPSVAALCEATMIFSDNGAANLLLPLVGGPAGLTRFVRALGDPVTRLDRNEPALNSALPGDPRDTTSPSAMLGNLQTLLLGDALSAGSRARLTAWLIDNRTGGARLRAGLPRDWKVGDKTGSGANGSVNDIGIAWPPSNRRRPTPILIASYMTGSPLDDAGKDAVHARVARAVSRAL